MASNSLACALMPSYISSVRHSYLGYKKVSLKIVSRALCALSRCNFSNAVNQLREIDKAAESDHRKTKIPILGEFENRNPRNEEYFGFNKPRGYSTQVYKVDFYNKLKFLITNRHTRAQVVHNSGLVLVSASTTEFEITRHLYKTTDVTAARNIGRVMAQRCLEAGITRVRWEIKQGDLRKKREYGNKSGTKENEILPEIKFDLQQIHHDTTAFSAAIKEGAVILSEPKKVIPPETYYSDFRPKKKRKKWRKLPYSKRWKAHMRKPK